MRVTRQENFNQAPLRPWATLEAWQELVSRERSSQFEVTVAVAVVLAVKEQVLEVLSDVELEGLEQLINTNPRREKISPFITLSFKKIVRFEIC